MIMPNQSTTMPSCNNSVASAADDMEDAVIRMKSKDLFGRMRELEIEHDGRIYRLRLTRLNKLILTA